MGLALIFYISIYLCGSSLAVPENVYGRKGSNYTFVCPHRKTPTNNILWGFLNKSGMVFAVSEGTFLASQYPAHDRVEVVGNHSNGEYNLKLSGLQETDEGTYRCAILLQQKSYYLELLVPPSVLVLYDVVNNTIIGAEGGSLIINCTAIGGKPEPELRLEVDSQVVAGKQSVSYAIAVIQKNHDKQLVKCQATSDALDSPLEQTATLYLYLKPSIPMFNTDRPTANETRQLVVSCTSTGSRPAGAFYWILNSSVVSSGYSQENTCEPSTDTYTMISTLTYSVDRSFNGQPITCGVTHQTLSSAVENIKTIYVYYPPNVTASDVTYNQKDATRTVTCTPIGNPAIYTYNKWQHKSKYGVTIRELDGKQDGILTLPDVPESERYQDAGEYVCIVGNGIGDKNGNIQQKGYGYVTINAQPVFTKDNKKSRTQYGETGKHVDIYIYVYSVPKYTTVKWSKVNREILQSAKYSMTGTSVVVHHDFYGNEVQLDGYRVTLTINLLTLEDFSNYTLKLSNGYDQPIEHEIVLEFGIADKIPLNECECSCDQNSTSQPEFVVVLTLTIATGLFWTVLGSIYYRRKLVAKREHLAYKDPKCATSYDEVVTSTDNTNRRQEHGQGILTNNVIRCPTEPIEDANTMVINPLLKASCQLDQYETLGAKDRPTVYEQLETNNRSSSAVPENVYGRKGSIYTFVCPHRKTTTNNVVWGFTNKSGMQITVSDGTYISPSNPAYDRVEVVGDQNNGEYNLKLSSLQETDEGPYRCAVSFQQKSYFLEILVAPSALVLNDAMNNTILGTEGGSLTINCTAVGGKPAPDLTLGVNSQVVTDKQSVQYAIAVVQRNHDKQLVKCQATSTAIYFPLETTATLYLYLKPSVPVFNTNTPTVNETQQLILSSTFAGSRPAGVIYWKLKSNVLTSGFIQQNTSDSSTDTYTMTSTLTYSVDRSYNGQPITCGVTHQTLSSAVENTKTVYVNYPPNVIVSDVTYNQSETTRTGTCNPIGNPETYTYYKWQQMSKYGVKIRELDGRQNGILTLPDVPESERYQDAGEYVCIVGNGIGDKNRNIQQKGYGYVTMNTQPVFTKDNKNSRTQYGETSKHVDIYIYVYSVPKYTIVKWSKVNREILQSAKYSMTDASVVVHNDFYGNEVQLDGYRVSLTINLLTSEDFSNYTLKLSNEYGQPVEHEVVLEFGIAAKIPVNECECSCDQNSTSQPVFVVVLTLTIATLLFWTVLEHLPHKDPKCATSYDEVVTSTNKRNRRQEEIIPEIQLDQYEILGSKDRPTVYEQLETNNS